jgi:uncharacterized iron-regulated membrane protein
MKLEPRTFRIEWDVHAWAGVIASTFLFVIFFCGIFALIHEELHTWQDPALHVAEAPDAAQPSFDALLALAKKHADIPHGADVGVGFDGVHTGHVHIEHPPTELEHELTFDLKTQQPLPEHTRLADELYLMHFFYRVPGGQEFAGAIAVALFIAVLSGLLMHLKDFKRQLWSFRPRLRLRFSASDAHKVLGVFGLPFTMMFAWTGALLGLWSLAFAGITGVAFQGDDARALVARGEETALREPTGNAAPMPSLDALAAMARAGTGAGAGAPISWMRTRYYGAERALTHVWFKDEGFGERPYAVIDARAGDVVRTQRDAPPSGGFERVMFALHFGTYGGMLINVLYLLLALAVCAVLVTGNVVWLERRDPKGEHAGNRFLARLTAGVCAGCVLSVAGYFAANRLLPRGMTDRGDWEFGLYLGLWALATLSAFLPRWSPRQHTVAQSALAAAMFLGVIAFDLIALDINIATAAARGVPRVLVIELLLLVLGAACAALAWVLAHSRPQR